MLTITATPDDGYALDTLELTGITANEDGSYTVTAQNGDPTPAISASFTQDEQDEPAPVKQLPTPTITSESGTSTVDVRGQIVQIACEESGVSLYYTMDGTDPTESSTKYTAANMYNSLQSLPNGQVTVKAIAVKNGWLDSEVASATFTITGSTVIVAYNISVQEGSENITFTVDGQSGVTTAYAGSQIAISAADVDVPEHYALILTYAYNETVVDISSQMKFTMPYADVTITAAIEAIPQRTLSIQSPIANGTVTLTLDDGTELTSGGDGPAAADVYVGQTVTVTATPDTGCKLSSLQVVDGDGKEVPISGSTFTMPNSNVTVAAQFEEENYTISKIVSPESGGVLEAEPVGNGVINITAKANDGYDLTALKYSVDGGTYWRALSVIPGEDGSVSASITVSVDEIMISATFASKSSAVRITSVDELLELAEAVNSGTDYDGRIVSLEADLDLSALEESWVPIGSSGNPFRGSFYGNGHSISGLNIVADSAYIEAIYDTNSSYIGLFGQVYGGVIRDLTVGGNIELTEDAKGSGNMYVGGVAGWTLDNSLTGDTASCFINCTSKVEIAMSRSAYVGGICGFATTWSGLLFYQCCNRGEISADCSLGYIGGIAGHMTGTMVQCANYAAITQTDSEPDYKQSNTGGALQVGVVPSGYIGGLVGWANNDGIISDSCNRADITSLSIRTGGLVGMANTSLASVLKIENCYNIGSVTNNAVIIRSTQRIGNGGILGNNYIAGRGVIIENCYNAGAVTTGGNVKSDEITLDVNAAQTNVYTSSEMQEQANIDTLLAALAADGKTNAYKPGASGLPILYWESENGEECTLTFAVTPDGAEVRLYSDAAMTTPVDADNDAGTVYTVTSDRTYFYTVSADGYVTETGRIAVSGDMTREVALRVASTVTFTVSPAGADFALTSGGSAVTPDSSESGDGFTSYTYTLYTGAIYTYSAYADGCNGVTRDYVVSGDAKVTVALTGSIYGNDGGTYIYGDGNEGMPHTITEGGVYYIGAGATGTLTVNTTAPVTLVGTGVGMNDVYQNLYIDCTSQTTDLTLRDVYISNTVGVANLINFYGEGNTLTFAGTSVLDQDTGASGYAMIHVGPTTELTITCDSDGDGVADGLAYLFKSDQGAGIGGNGGADGSEGGEPEYNGAITIVNATLFIKGVKQGALIGSGAQAKSSSFTPGAIVIRGSDVNLIPTARGAGIGGGAGSGGAASGADVYVEDSRITININYSGAAIGGGGFDASNPDAFVDGKANDADGGTLHYISGSIRVFIDSNATTAWGVENPGVNGNKAVTASVINADEKPLYLLELDVSKAEAENGIYTVTDEGGYILYSGSLHQWRYVNEAAEWHGSSEVPITYTMDNWVTLDDDPCLYLYLTGQDQQITVNGVLYDVTWNAESETLTAVLHEESHVHIYDDGVVTVEPTCTEDGVKTYTCVDGDDSYTEVIPATGHTPGEAVVENEVAATETTEGSYDLVIYCTACGDELSRETVTVPTIPCPSAPYIDVDTSKWYHEAIDYAIVHHLLYGVGGNRMDPEGAMTRAMFVTILYRLAGSPAVTGSTPFNDLTDGWYQNAVLWAYQNGITFGTSATTFAPNAQVTRQEMVTFLYRYARFVDPDTGSGVSPDSFYAFDDCASVNGWAVEAMIWATDVKVIIGSDNRINPFGVAWRAEGAQMFMNFAKRYC